MAHTSVLRVGTPDCVHTTGSKVGAQKNLFSLCMRAQPLSHIQLCNPWAVSHQAPLSMGLSRREYCRRLPFPIPGDLPDPGIKPTSPALEGRFFTSEPPGKLFQLPLVLKTFSFEMCLQTKCYCCDAQLSPNWCYRVTQHGVSLMWNNQCVCVFLFLKTLAQTHRWKEPLVIT